MKRVQWVAGVVVVAALLAAYAWSRHTAAYEIPALAFQSTGSVEGVFDVPTRALYAVSLRYEFDSQEARRLAWDIAQKAPFDVAVTLKTPAGDKVVDATIQSPRMTSFTDRELEAELTRLELPPGRYAIVARRVNGAWPTNVPIKIAIAPAYVGK